MNSSKDRIEEAFENPEIISEALAKAARNARRKHKQAGNPIVVWRDGEAVWIPAEDIPDDKEV